MELIDIWNINRYICKVLTTQEFAQSKKYNSDLLIVK